MIELHNEYHNGYLWTVESTDTMLDSDRYAVKCRDISIPDDVLFFEVVTETPEGISVMAESFSASPDFILNVRDIMASNFPEALPVYYLRPNGTLHKLGG